MRRFITARETMSNLTTEFSAAEQEQLADDEDVIAIFKRLIEKNRQAYEVLAK